MHRVAETRHGTLVGNTVPTPWHFDFWGRDKAGNWTNKGAQTYTHGDHHEVTASSHIFDTITYDGNMNMSADGGLWTYEYDAEDRLRTVRLRSDGSLRSEYAYDALGRRVYKGGYGGWMRFWYDGQRRIEDYDLVWNVVGYRYFYGEYVDEPVVMDNLHWWGGRYWYHQDHLFNVVAMTGTTGAVAERIWYYQPFGEFISYDGNWTNAQGGGSRVANPFLYTGREYDGESGTYYYRARTFHPVLGRFLQRDPLGYVDGPNLYEYVSGRATTAVDPEGTWQQDMHFHMTYYLARLCGLTRAVRAWGGNTMSEAYVIAWHNQYTDDHSETMPGKSPFTESNRAHFHFRGGVVVAMSRAMTAIADHAVQMAYGDRLRGTGGSPETMAMWLMPRFR